MLARSLFVTGAMAAGSALGIVQAIRDPSSLLVAGPSRLRLPATASRGSLFVVVDLDPRGREPFVDDFFRLAASLSDWPTTCCPTGYAFESTYNSFELLIADVTGDGIEELLLVHGTGRGTGVRTENLVVLRLVDGVLRPMFNHPISQHYGHVPGCRWLYTVAAETDRTGPQSLLRLKLDPPDPACGSVGLPAAVEKTYLYDSALDRLVLEEWHRDGSGPALNPSLQRTPPG